MEFYYYTDDNTELCSGTCLKDIKEKLLFNIKIFMRWYNGINMKVNSEECQCIVFGNVEDLSEFITVLLYLKNN